MRQSKLLIPTLREAPSEAETISHQLLLRAGFIRQVASGIYTYLPLGWRVLKKISDIVRDEMDRIDAQEILMSAIQPAELWHLSGRYTVYGEELIRFKDRHDREFILGPTHEEVITTLVRNEIDSYRKLPLTLYQIQTKFRDERRPRFGLIRGREFLMKDAYSFDTSWEELDQTYWNMYEAYSRIFDRCGLNFRPVEADAGAIGGEGVTHEFMALSDIGEDTVVTCNQCEYAANLEKASAHLTRKSDGSTLQYERIYTPNSKTIKELVISTNFEEKDFVKTLIYKSDGMLIAVLVRGDHEVNETKLKYVLDADVLELADAATTQGVTGSPVGFAGPIGLKIPVIADHEVTALSSFIVGANEEHYHLKNVVTGRDFQVSKVNDIRNVVEGDPCPRCSGTLLFHRGIEVGHVFKLGTKYSEQLGAKYLDKSGKEQVMIMGCYGIGISRIISAIVEQNHDNNGMIWTTSIAPYQVHIIVVSMKDQTQMDTAEEIYQRLQKCKVEVLIDDRDERPGVKFKDADLIGIPIQIIIGKHSAEGQVEFKDRKSNVVEIMSIDDAYYKIMNRHSEGEKI
jgi:prolyl-tRNA synthetase